MWKQLGDYLYWRHCWAECAARGWCDAIDSAEYRRVTAAWLASDQTGGRIDFIRLEANKPNPGEYRSELIKNILRYLP